MNPELQDGSTSYGADELHAIAGLCGMPGFPGVHSGLYAGLDREAREAALRSARRSLLARGVVDIDEEGILRVVPPHSVSFRVALAPAAVVTVELRRPDSIETRSYYVLPEIGVEHEVAIGQVHRLTQFETTQLFSRVRELLGLVERPAGDSVQFETPVAALNQALAVAASVEGDRPDLPPKAAAFEEALPNLLSTSFVRSLHRSGSALVGGELRWIDTGESGLWRVEPSEDGAERVSVRPAQAQELMDELLSYLPGGERQPAAT